MSDDSVYVGYLSVIITVCMCLNDIEDCVAYYDGRIYDKTKRLLISFVLVLQYHKYIKSLYLYDYFKKLIRKNYILCYDIKWAQT